MRFLSALLFLAACGSETTMALMQNAPFVEDEVVFGLRTDATDEEINALLDRHGLERLRWNDGLGMLRARITDGRTVDQVVAESADESLIRYVEPNYIVTADAIPNDTSYNQQWGLRAINASAAWDVTMGEGVIVAVLDTGVSPNGRDGIGDLLVGYDAVYNRSAHSDRQGHGTHVSGTVCQTTNNGYGAAGVAPRSTVLPVKVLSDSGSGSMSDVAEGIWWAADNGAKVINMSLSSSGYSQAVRDAEVYADRLGVTMVAATGNNGWSSSGYPAADPLVIGVGATTSSNQIASFSNGGNGLDIVAPGSGILQETVSGRFESWNGTSMASPHVAGVAALLVAVGLDDPATIRQVLTETAIDMSSPGWDTWSGHGRLNAEAAVNRALQLVGTNPPNNPPNNPPADTGVEEEDPTPPPDLTSPEMSAIRFVLRRGGVDIYWTTDEPASTDVEWSGWGIYQINELVIDHHRPFTLSSGYRYWARIRTRDAAGNESIAGWVAVDVP